MILSRAILRGISLGIVHDGDSPFRTNHLDNRSNMPIINHVTMKCVDRFMSCFNIVIRNQSGSLSRSPAHVRFINKQVGYHLEEMKRRFDDFLDGSMVENIGHLHFLFV